MTDEMEKKREQVTLNRPVDQIRVFSSAFPFPCRTETIFLKTALPHRKAAKDYLKEKGEEP